MALYIRRYRWSCCACIVIVFFCARTLPAAGDAVRLIPRVSAAPVYDVDVRLLVASRVVTDGADEPVRYSHQSVRVECQLATADDSSDTSKDRCVTLHTTGITVHMSHTEGRKPAGREKMVEYFESIVLEIRMVDDEGRKVKDIRVIEGDSEYAQGIAACLAISCPAVPVRPGSMWEIKKDNELGVLSTSVGLRYAVLEKQLEGEYRNRDGDSRRKVVKLMYHNASKQGVASMVSHMDPRTGAILDSVFRRWEEVGGRRVTIGGLKEYRVTLQPKKANE